MCFSGSIASQLTIKTRENVFTFYKQTLTLTSRLTTHMYIVCKVLFATVYVCLGLVYGV